MLSIWSHPRTLMTFFIKWTISGKPPVGWKSHQGSKWGHSNVIHYVAHWLWPCRNLKKSVLPPCIFSVKSVQTLGVHASSRRGRRCQDLLQKFWFWTCPFLSLNLQQMQDAVSRSPFVLRSHTLNEERSTRLGHSVGTGWGRRLREREVLVET